MVLRGQCVEGASPGFIALVAPNLSCIAFKATRAYFHHTLKFLTIQRDARPNLVILMYNFVLFQLFNELLKVDMHDYKKKTCWLSIKPV